MPPPRGHHQRLLMIIIILLEVTAIAYSLSRCFEVVAYFVFFFVVIFRHNRLLRHAYTLTIFLLRWNCGRIFLLFDGISITLFILVIVLELEISRWNCEEELVTCRRVVVPLLGLSHVFFNILGFYDLINCLVIRIYVESGLQSYFHIVYFYC